MIYACVCVCVSSLYCYYVAEKKTAIGIVQGNIDEAGELVSKLFLLTPFSQTVLFEIIWSKLKCPCPINHWPC